MNILFIHVGFPGQYLHICQQLIDQKMHMVASIGMTTSPFKNSKKYQHIQYQPHRGNSENIHPWTLDIETKAIRAEACGKACQKLKEQGFTPDIICGHPGWGELLAVPYIWPNKPILMYQEFYYNAYGYDCNFDPELQQDHESWEDQARVHFKNANSLLNLDHATWNVTPTQFQKSSFPQQFHSNIAVIHDGISNKARPAKSKSNITVDLGVNKQITEKDKLITFVNRNLEPYRGCHSFIRSIPLIQEKHPDCKIVIIGNTKGVSYGKKCPDGEWKDVFLKEIEGNYNPENVLFVGQTPYEVYLNLLKLSRAHVYLTYPFVLSWSLLEAMSTGCPIVGSDTGPVTEVIDDRVHGLLVDFFDPKGIAKSVDELLHNKNLASELGKNANLRAIDRYSLENCLPRQLELIDLVGRGVIGT